MTEYRKSPDGVIASRQPVSLTSSAEWNVVFVPQGGIPGFYITQALPPQAVAFWRPVQETAR